MSDSLQTKIRTLLDKLYGANSTEPPSFFFEAVYMALPELEELDPQRVRQMVAIAFAQKKLITHRMGKKRYETWLPDHAANRSPEYVKHVEHEHEQAVRRHA